MNERIKELLVKAGTYDCDPSDPEFKLSDVPEDYLKFAELIVRECARRSYLEDSGNPEVEEALEFWRKDMLEHFGVEE